MLNANSAVMERFTSLIRDKCGLSFDSNSMANLRNALLKRMNDTGESDLNNYYLRCLRNEQDEISSLINILTINETYFFREPKQHAIFAQQLFPELLRKKKRGEKIKIVSAGCSTGEEPYTIAINLIEKYGPAILNNVSIIGADIDSRAIKRATEGMYGSISFRGVEKRIIDTYFIKNGDQCYELIDRVKKNVAFVQMNLTEDHYPQEIHDADFIYYRNVSIYFDQEIQLSIFKKLSKILSMEGYIFLSSAETYFYNVGILYLMEIDGIFIYKKSRGQTADSRSAITPSPAYSLRQPPSSQAKLRRTARTKKEAAAEKEEVSANQDKTHTLFDEALRLMKGKKHLEALEKIRALLNLKPSSSKAQTLQAGILLNLQRLDEAEASCARAIEQDEWNFESYLLSGLISKYRSNDEEALRKLKSCLYIKKECWLAHFYIAEIHATHNRLEEASREYKMVAKLIEKHGMEQSGLLHFPIAFTPEQMVHLCKHNLSDLTTRMDMER